MKTQLDGTVTFPSCFRRARRSRAAVITRRCHSSTSQRSYSGSQSKRGGAPKALLLTILTATRTSEALNAVWAEIDLKVAKWTIPAARMKSGINHIVPLSGAALVVLHAQHVLPRGTGDFVFPGAKEGRPLSNMSMEMVLRRMNERSVTVHGFRSSFRDWAGELTDHARETAEAALAHAVGNEVEAAYRRGTSLDKRVKLMQDWADYLAVEV